MNKDEEIDKRLKDDIIPALKKQSECLYAVGMMVIAIGGMTVGIIGLLLCLITEVL